MVDYIKQPQHHKVLEGYEECVAFLYVEKVTRWTVYLICTHVLKDLFLTEGVRSKRRSTYIRLPRRTHE